MVANMALDALRHVHIEGMRDATDLEVLFHTSDPKVLDVQYVDPELPNPFIYTGRKPDLILTSLWGAVRHAPENVEATWHNITETRACHPPHKSFVWLSNLIWTELKAVRTRQIEQVGIPHQTLATKAQIEDILHQIEKSKKCRPCPFEPVFK